MSRAESDRLWFNHPLLGHCFSSSKKFIQVEFGKEQVGDENLVLNPAVPLTDGSTWVVDHTPMTNYQWYLLQPGKNRQLCLTLFVPNAVQADLTKDKGKLTVKTKTQAAPGFSEKNVTFKKRNEEIFFKPVSCVEVLYSEAGLKKIRQVHCSDIFK